MHSSAPRASRVRTTSTPAALAACLVLGACALPLEEEGPLESERGLETKASAIEGGELRPSSLNAGTVHIGIYKQVSTRRYDLVEQCSGQVISRDSVLTAAHCFYGVGAFADGWTSAPKVIVRLRHQDPDGTWDELNSANALSLAKAYTLKSYYDIRAAHPVEEENERFGYDVAVLQVPISFNKLDSSDATALVRYTDTAKPSALWAYGHGLASPNFQHASHGPSDKPGIDDDQLRRGKVDAFTWHNSQSANFPYTIEYDRGSSGPKICTGDSGGPWKIKAEGADISGIQFGVTSSLIGGQKPVEDGMLEGCGWEGARAARVDYYDGFIKDAVEKGSGTCTYGQHTFKSGSSHTIATMLCW